MLAGKSEASMKYKLVEKKTPAALGGEARAIALSPGERKEIARAAALARWSRAEGIPRETHIGEIKIGTVTLPCAVLEDGRRILKTMGITRAFGSKKKTANVPAPGGLPQPPAFLATEGVKGSISPELLEKIHSPAPYRPVNGGQIGYGYDADVLPAICETILDAKRANRLHKNQGYLVDSAMLLLRGLARVGIVALVDEATGYQEVRDRQALQAILDRFLRIELAAWAKRFPDEFYRHIFRLKNWQWKGMSVNRPQVVAHYTKDLVYARLAPGILNELEVRTPRAESGHRKAKFHQWLTDDVGHPALAQHLHAVIGLMRASKTWDQFLGMINMAFPKRGETLQLPFMSDDPNE